MNPDNRRQADDKACDSLNASFPHESKRKRGPVYLQANDEFWAAAMAVPFPASMAEFNNLLPDDGACSAYLERLRWKNGFVCPYCDSHSDPYRFTGRIGIFRCSNCLKDVSLTVGTVMERTRVPIKAWCQAAWLLASRPDGISASQFQQGFDLTRYETLFRMFHKLRARMATPEHVRLGGGQCSRIEADEVWIGGSRRARSVNGPMLVIAAVEILERSHKNDKPETGRLRLTDVPSKTDAALCGFIDMTVEPATPLMVTDAWSGYSSLSDRVYGYFPAAGNDSPDTVKNVECHVPVIPTILGNMKDWLAKTHRGVSSQHLQAYLNEFAFHFNHRFDRLNAFKHLLGVGEAVGYDGD